MDKELGTKEYYFQQMYNARNLHHEGLRNIIMDAWNAIPDDFIVNFYLSLGDRYHAVKDTQRRPTRS